MPKLKITLKSDLCAASGDGFSSVIDTDVSYDRYGFPLIGARRIKGCLREAAGWLGYSEDEIEAVFGSTGSSTGGSLKLSDAHPADYEALIPEAVRHSAAEVISLYSYTRAATAIENDTAKDGSLRFTRVIRRYSPFDQKETVFEADAELDAQYGRMFSEICAALRNIGYKRNRGYGAVKCEYISDQRKAAVMQKPEAVSDTETSFSYTVFLADDLMLPAAVSDETADFISGSSVLGYFAGQYLETNPVDDVFEELFLKQNLRFSNLYLSDENGAALMPAPVILGKIKGEPGVYNIVTYDNKDNKIIKPVKHGFCDFSCQMKQPVMETVYHHSTGKDATLYTQTALSRGQYFCGTISGKREYVEMVFRFLQDAKESGIRLHFGRSKTAQYSACEVISVKKPEEPKQQNITLKKGDVFIALLCSDVLIPDHMGGYALSAAALQNELGAEFTGMKSDISSALRYRVIAGYNTKWNIQKPHIRTFAAGSTMVFKAEQNMTLPQYRLIGTKQNEGFGVVMLARADAFSPVQKVSAYRQDRTKGLFADLIEKQKAREEMRNTAIKYVKEHERDYNDINSSQIGRFIMMVKQSKNLAALRSLINADKEGDKHAHSVMGDFEKLQHQAFMNYKEKDDWREYLLLILTLIKYRKRGEAK